MEFTKNTSREATTNVNGVEIKYTVSYEAEAVAGVQGTILKDEMRVGSLSYSSKYGNMNMSLEKKILTADELPSVLLEIIKDVVNLIKS